MTRYSPRTGLPTEYQAGPFDAEHVYLTWGGKLPGLETWSCSLRLAAITPGDLTNDPAWLASAKTAVQTFHASPLTGICPLAKLSFVKAQVIKADGHYKYNTPNEIVVADVSGGHGTGNPSHPLQVALGVSLLTGFSRGPAHKGRFYVPLPNQLPQSDGLISTTESGNVKTTATTLVTALNAITPNLQVAVFSRKAGAPAHRLVTTVSVGRALDTQRRRRKKVPELYN